MIDAKPSGRYTGKTKELINIYLSKGGLYVAPNMRSLEIMARGVKDSDFCPIHKFSQKKGETLPNNLYFDEFFSQEQIKIEDVVELDRRGYNIYLRGTPDSRFHHQNNLERFIKYCEETYPEQYI